MKKVIYSILFWTLVRLIKDVKKPNIINEKPNLKTVGEEYYPPPDTASKEEKKAHFDNWCQHTGVSSKWVPNNKLDYAKESTIISLKHE